MAIKKSTSFTIVFVMTDDAGVIQTGKTVSAFLSKDGEAFTSASNSVVEISNGFYKLILTSTETYADVIALYLTAAGCLQQNLVFYSNDLVNTVDIMEDGIVVQVKNVSHPRQKVMTGKMAYFIQKSE